jgi:hypothetical protein
MIFHRNQLLPTRVVESRCVHILFKLFSSIRIVNFSAILISVIATFSLWLIVNVWNCHFAMLADSKRVAFIDVPDYLILTDGGIQSLRSGIGSVSSESDCGIGFGNEFSALNDPRDRRLHSDATGSEGVISHETQIDEEIQNPQFSLSLQTPKINVNECVTDDSYTDFLSVVRASPEMVVHEPVRFAVQDETANKESFRSTCISDVCALNAMADELQKEVNPTIFKIYKTLFSEFYRK